jgi:hypothetical protein
VIQEGEQFQGTITDGTCIYPVNSGFRQPPIYVATCDNGQKITATDMTLMLVPSPISEGPRYKNSKTNKPGSAAADVLRKVTLMLLLLIQETAWPK